MLSREQRLWVRTGHDSEPIKFAEHSWHAQQAAEHVARHHGSREHHALHGCGRHGSKSGSFDRNSGIDWEFYEPWNGDTKRGDCYPNARNCNPQSRASDSEPEHSNAEHNTQNSEHAADSRYGNNSPDVAKFAKQRHAARARVDDKSWKRSETAESNFAASGFNVNESESDSPTALTSDGFANGRSSGVGALPFLLLTFPLPVFHLNSTISPRFRSRQTAS
jgi:hypothetical protein